MLNNNLLEKKLKKIKIARFLIIIISIVLCVVLFIVRDCCEQKWADYLLFLLPYISTLVYSCFKQKLLKSEMFIEDKNAKIQDNTILQNMNDCMLIIIKYLKL